MKLFAPKPKTLPIIINDRGYEFQVFCPWYNCEKGILFNRNLINQVVKCPRCKDDVLLNLAPIQETGIEHIRKLKSIAMKIWVKTDQGPDTWKECINFVMKNHRLHLLKIGTYDAFRPVDGWPGGKVVSLAERLDI